MQAKTELVAQAVEEWPMVEAQEGGAEIIDRLAEEWRELCSEGLSDEPFYRPEWIAAWVRAFAPRKRLLVITARVGGQLKAVLPLIRVRTLFHGLPVRKLLAPANAYSCRFDLIRGVGAAGDAAVLAVWNFIKDLSGWDLLEVPYVPKGGALEKLVAAAQSDGFPTAVRESWRTPYIPLTQGEAGKDGWLLHTDARFRANLRRRMSKLTAQGDLRLQRMDKADPAALQRFYDLERAGWKGREDSALACQPETLQFYQEIARSAASFGYLSLYFLDYCGRTIAAHFGLTHRGRYFVPKLAYDEDYREYGPGHLLVDAVLRDCAERKVSEFDFLGQWTEWKGEWTQKIRQHDHWYVFAKALYGRALHLGRFKIAPVIKKMLGSRR